MMSRRSVAASVSQPLRPLPGAVLLFAGLLKLLSDGAFAGAGEVSLGLWLLLGIWQQAASLVAAGAYLLFIALNVWALFHGHDSCGCLGGAEVSPSWMLVLDLCMLTVLLLAIRGPTPRSEGKQHGVLGLRCSTIGGTVVAAVVFSSYLRPPQDVASDPMPVTASPGAAFADIPEATEAASHPEGDVESPETRVVGASMPAAVIPSVVTIDPAAGLRSSHSATWNPVSGAPDIFGCPPKRCRGEDRLGEEQLPVRSN